MGQKSPTTARWLLEKALTGHNREALIGDLDEEFARGQSAWWYWRQAIVAVARSPPARWLPRDFSRCVAYLWVGWPSGCGLKL